MIGYLQITNPLLYAGLALISLHMYEKEFIFDAESGEHQEMPGCSV